MLEVERELFAPSSAERARYLAREHAYRLYALASAMWPRDFDWSYVEEELRETSSFMAVSFRRVIENHDLKEHLPTLKPDRFKLGDEWPASDNLWDQLGVLAHVKSLMVHIGGVGPDGAVQVGYLNVKSDKRHLFIDPLCLSSAIIKIANLIWDYDISNPTFEV